MRNYVGHPTLTTAIREIEDPDAKIVTWATFLALRVIFLDQGVGWKEWCKGNENKSEGDLLKATRELFEIAHRPEFSEQFQELSKAERKSLTDALGILTKLLGQLRAPVDGAE